MPVVRRVKLADMPGCYSLTSSRNFVLILLKLADGGGGLCFALRICSLVFHSSVS